LADAIIFAWYPGQEGGNALASILFGDYNPAGRLPITFYKSVSDLPAFEDYSMENRSYRYFTGEALYEFGYGLSYAEFEYVQLSIQKDSPDRLEVKCMLRNTSSRDGEEVVQLYIREESDRIMKPLKTLKGFQRILLKAGEEKEVVFLVQVEELKHWDVQSQDFIINNSQFHVEIASSSSIVHLMQSIDIKE